MAKYISPINHDTALVFSKMYHSSKLLELSDLPFFSPHRNRGNIFNVPGEQDD